ncbi:hypothetical protein Tco_1273533 [Tanacetum coccineum]
MTHLPISSRLSSWTDADNRMLVRIRQSSGGDTGDVQITERIGEDVEKQENVKEKMVELDQRPAGLDLVQESLKFPADKHVILEDPLSSTGNLSSMKNLEDAYAIGDQFINEKSTDDEPRKLNVEAEVVSMVTVPIYQAHQFLCSTTNITPTTLPPPPQQQSTTESELAERVTTLEKKILDLEQTNKNLDNTTRNLGSRVYTLELRYLPHKINEAVCENVKVAVQIDLQAPLRDRFRDLPK